MPIPLVPEKTLAAAAQRAVRRAIATKPAMTPPQIAAVVRNGCRACTPDQLRDLIEEQIELQQQRSSHWSWTPDRMIALRQALVSTGADDFEAAWDQWRGA